MAVAALLAYNKGSSVSLRFAAADTPRKRSRKKWEELESLAEGIDQEYC